MKHLAVIPLVLVASCASKPYVFQDALPAPGAKPTVRYPEVIRAYPVGPCHFANRENARMFMSAFVEATN